MYVRASESVIEQAGSRESRLDAACASQSEVLETGNSAIDGEFAH